MLHHLANQFAEKSNGTFHGEGQKSGEETHTLAANEMPQHNHTFHANTAVATLNSAGGNALAGSAPNEIYQNNPSFVDMKGSAISNAGGGQAHNNMMPYLALNFCIALRGLFPSRN